MSARNRREKKDEWVLVSAIAIPERTSDFRLASLLSRRQSEKKTIERNVCVKKP